MRANTISTVFEDSLMYLYNYYYLITYLIIPIKVLNKTEALRALGILLNYLIIKISLFQQ